ncbi:hypothetical protein [Thiolapillus sp.]|uniref:hypothetical protein n=2 Tax=Thiolapillus sp. TaxID=2017437 RepID=UPI003AF72BD1
MKHHQGRFLPAGLLACWLRCLAFCQLPFSQSAALLASANPRLLSLCRFVIGLLASMPGFFAGWLAGCSAVLPLCRLCCLRFGLLGDSRKPVFLSACLCWFAFGGHIATCPVIVPSPPFMFTFFFFYRPSSYSVVHFDILMFAFVYSSIVYILFMFAFVYSSVAYILLMFAFVYSFIVDIPFMFAFVLLDIYACW